MVRVTPRRSATACQISATVIPPAGPFQATAKSSYWAGVRSPSGFTAFFCDRIYSCAVPCRAVGWRLAAGGCRFLDDICGHATAVLGGTHNPLPARACGFKSLLRYEAAPVVE